MLKIDNSLLQEIGLGGLPETEKNGFLKHVYETLEMRVGIRLADQMTNEQLDEFEQYFEAKDDAGAFKWLESNFPNYKEIVQQEFDKLKAEIAQQAPQILAASQAQAAQAVVPGAVAGTPGMAASGAPAGAGPGTPGVPFGQAGPMDGATQSIQQPPQVSGQYSQSQSFNPPRGPAAPAPQPPFQPSQPSFGPPPQHPGGPAPAPASPFGAAASPPSQPPPAPPEPDNPFSQAPQPPSQPFQPPTPPYQPPSPPAASAPGSDSAVPPPYQAPTPPQPPQPPFPPQQPPAGPPTS